MSGMYWEFVKGLVQDPRGVSAPTPSSPALAAAIADKVDASRSGMIVELGAGTGVVTDALIARGIPQERLIVVECGSYYAECLARRFPNSTVLCGDAFCFESLLPDGTEIAAVVSGVPLLNFSPSEREGLIGRALDAQRPGGAFVQLSYGWNPPVQPTRHMSLTKDVVWRNFPPAHIWTYKKVAATARTPRLRLVTTH